MATRIKPDAKVERRVMIDGSHLFAWNAQIGPILNPGKILKIAQWIPNFAQARHWSLRFNQIRKVELTKVDLERYDVSKSIQNLDLSCNAITHLNTQSIPFLNLNYLNLSNNRLSDISYLHLLSGLKELYLSNNRITSLRFLRGPICCPSLEVLDISNNHLSSLSTIGELVLLTNLKWLSLEGNRLPIGHLIEGFVILACPNLKHFGGEKVTPSIRRDVEFWSVTDSEGAEVVECVNLFCEAFMGEGHERSLPTQDISIEREEEDQEICQSQLEELQYGGDQTTDLKRNTPIRESEGASYQEYEKPKIGPQVSFHFSC